MISRDYRRALIKAVYGANMTFYVADDPLAKDAASKITVLRYEVDRLRLNLRILQATQDCLEKNFNNLLQDKLRITSRDVGYKPDPIKPIPATLYPRQRSILRMATDDYTPVDFDKIIRDTSSAILFEIDEEEVWIPKSCIEWDWVEELNPNDLPIDRGMGWKQVPVLEQFAIQKGLV